MPRTKLFRGSCKATGIQRSLNNRAERRSSKRHYIFALEELGAHGVEKGGAAKTPIPPATSKTGVFLAAAYDEFKK